MSTPWQKPRKSWFWMCFEAISAYLVVQIFHKKKKFHQFFTSNGLLILCKKLERCEATLLQKPWFGISFGLFWPYFGSTRLFLQKKLFVTNDFSNSCERSKNKKNLMRKFLENPDLPVILTILERFCPFWDFQEFLKQKEISYFS